MKTGGGFEKKHVAKECAFVAVFVALVIAIQLVLSVIPGVELVTVLFVSYAYVFGKGRGMVASTAFSLLRQLVFGFYPLALILYLIYFNALSVFFGFLGGKMRDATKIKTLVFIVVFACVGTVCFSALDAVLNVVWFGYTWDTARMYILATLPVMGVQTACTAVTVSVLFLPLVKGLQSAKKGL